jgi:hypothetical protein
MLKPAVVALAIVLSLSLDPSGAKSPSPHVVRRFFAARHSVCDHPPRSPLTYHYPIKPFLRQHPIRANFGDPRTLTTEEFGADTPRSPGSFTFHNGVDISAPTGTPVFPVASGVAAIGYADEVVVYTGDGRTFQYFHIRPFVRPGQRVAAYRTVLGTVRPEWLHVHLTEIDGDRVHNPVGPGHLQPYRDHTIPIVERLFFSDASGKPLDPTGLKRRVHFVAQASDVPPIPVPGDWFDARVTPALMRWRLETRSGRVVVPERVVADFRHTEPPDRDFWRIYASGTYQNFPVFGHHYFFGRPGRYLFNLTPKPFDTRRLHNGDYVLKVSVADVCGNRSSLAEAIQVHNLR